jgi:hypothetical protein
MLTIPACRAARRSFFSVPKRKAFQHNIIAFARNQQFGVMITQLTNPRYSTRFGSATIARRKAYKSALLPGTFYPAFLTLISALEVKYGQVKGYRMRVSDYLA